MIELHEFPPAWGINPSPFCLKLEAHLKLAGIPYKPVVTMPFRAPRGKLPFIVADGRRIADSGHVVEHLQQNAGVDLDAGLDDEQRAVGHLLRRTCEESLYFAIVYSRWADPAGWAAFRPTLVASMPAAIGWLIPPLARRTARKALWAQGYGRHTREEVYAIGAADLAAIRTMLAGHDFAVADHPTSIDAVLYATLASIITPPIETPLKEAAMRSRDLVDYVARLEKLLPSPPLSRREER